MKNNKSLNMEELNQVSGGKPVRTINDAMSSTNALFPWLSKNNNEQNEVKQ